MHQSFFHACVHRERDVRFVITNLQTSFNLTRQGPKLWILLCPESVFARICGRQTYLRACACDSVHMRSCACVCVWGITPAFVYVCLFACVCVCVWMCGGECMRALYILWLTAPRLHAPCMGLVQLVDFPRVSACVRSTHILVREAIYFTL